MDLRQLESNRQRMAGLLGQLVGQTGVRPSTLDGVKLFRLDTCTGRIPVMYEPSIVIVAQGQKRGYLGDQQFLYDARNYLVLTVPLPFECVTETGPDGPFLGIGVRIDLGLVSDLLMKMPQSRPQSTRLAGPFVPSQSTVDATPMTLALSDAALRLVECLFNPADAEVLGPQIMREITYRVLQGSQGVAVQSLLTMDSTRMQMHRVLHRMHSEYAKPLDVSVLASEAGMSISALHHHFKALANTSPLQYLKAVRLHKARMFMVQDALAASIAAERVGYESPSQFSREFKRFFGQSPTAELQRMRASLVPEPRVALIAS